MVESLKTLRVLFTAAEADPLIKVGGLGDVTGTLARVFRALQPADTLGYQLDVRLAIPFHSAISARLQDYEPLFSFTVPHPDGPIPAQAFLTHIGDLPVYLIQGPPFEKDMPVYSLDTQKDGEKYTFFSLAVLELVRVLNWVPDILHAHDWHTALSVYSLKLRRPRDPFFTNTRSILTIHNLPFMGAGTDKAMKDYGIPLLIDPRLPVWGGYQPLPMGLATADQVSTVSPTYAEEIMTPEFGCGLENFLQMRADSISGILNGLDETLWDPAADPALARNYSLNTLDHRLANKQALLRELSLSPNLDLPLLVLIGRMDRQKGIDLAIKGLRQVSGMPWQAIILGTGDPVLEMAARQLEAEFPNRVRAIIQFDVPLSRRMYAGGDMLLMPSRYEPCGMAQMIAMRYGCLPIARSTGGLRDTVKDTRSPETSTGFIFKNPTPKAMAAVLRRAITAYANQQDWRLRQICGMQQDYSWGRSAHDYVQLYHRLCSQAILV